MCFHIIPLCPACEEPSGLGEEIIYAEDICSGRCTGDDVVGTTTRPMTQFEVHHYYADRAVASSDNRVRATSSRSSSSGAEKDGGSGRGGHFFECLTPGCDAVAAAEDELSADQEEQMVQSARDHAKVYLRDKYENCLSLCILPFVEAPIRGSGWSVQLPLPSDSECPATCLSSRGYLAPPSLGKAVSRRGVRQERPWSKKRGKPWAPDEEAMLWKLRQTGMEFDAIADQIDRTERGCYDRYNKLRNEGYGRTL